MDPRIGVVLGLWPCAALADSIPSIHVTHHAGGNPGPGDHGPEDNAAACAHVLELSVGQNPPGWKFECVSITLDNLKLTNGLGGFPWYARYVTRIKFISPTGAISETDFHLDQKYGCPVGYEPQGDTAESSWCWNGVGPNANPKKNFGIPKTCEGNPCDAGTGNKYQIELDYRGAGAFPLHLERIYNSGPVEAARYGRKWRGSYDRSIQSGAGPVTLKRPDGRQFSFRWFGSSWTSDGDVVGKLEQTPTGWKFTNDADEVETYDTAGKLITLTNRTGLTQTLTYSSAATPPEVALIPGLLITVTDPYGRQLNFIYNSGNRVSSMTDPAGETYTYTYAPEAVGSGMVLSSVIYPGGASRSYLYGEAGHVSPTPDPEVNNGRLLTGLIDENNNRYGTWSYDAQGRVITSEHGVGVDKVTLTYSVDPTTSVPTTSVLDALGGVRNHEFQTVWGVMHGARQTRENPTAETSVTLDANGNVASRIDWNGNRTNYTYDLTRNLETSRTEGLTTSGATTPESRTISTTWHPNFRLPTQVVEPKRTTTYVYDPDGMLCLLPVSPAACRGCFARRP